MLSAPVSISATCHSRQGRPVPSPSSSGASPSIGCQNSAMPSYIAACQPCSDGRPASRLCAWCCWNILDSHTACAMTGRQKPRQSCGGEDRKLKWGSKCGNSGVWLRQWHFSTRSVHDHPPALPGCTSAHHPSLLAWMQLITASHSRCGGTATTSQLGGAIARRGRSSSSNVPCSSQRAAGVCRAAPSHTQLVLLSRCLRKLKCSGMARLRETRGEERRHGVMAGCCWVLRCCRWWGRQQTAGEHPGRPTGTVHCNSAQCNTAQCYRRQTCPIDSHEAQRLGPNHHLHRHVACKDHYHGRDSRVIRAQPQL